MSRNNLIADPVADPNPVPDVMIPVDATEWKLLLQNIDKLEGVVEDLRARVHKIESEKEDSAFVDGIIAAIETNLETSSEIAHGHVAAGPATSGSVPTSHDGTAIPVREKSDVFQREPGSFKRQPGISPGNIGIGTETENRGQRNSVAKKKLRKKQPQQGVLPKFHLRSVNCVQPEASSSSSVEGNGMSTRRGVVQPQKSSNTFIRAFECDTCHKRYFNKLDIREHVRGHEKGLQCNCCGQFFKISNELLPHERERIHNMDRAYMCESCSKKFDTHLRETL